ncbi:hypothetical protein [Actinoplanes sp. NBRC 101535]|uniref:hypothetical protein n=1 Tax=Actinoplanes sp. NBRC 101535 TaxID=3032196 RepID=UPI0024A0BC4B|nr:hypothetical protein [Actinoplanes sp. NBRC 101535]GLY06291.1 hypothetical protein Acsp01_66700 [Actinoplanes sp. NBRC 101535]
MRIDREQAVAIARAAADRAGKEWIGPIHVGWGWWRYTIRTRADFRGGNLVVTVDRRTGGATVSGPSPR